MVRRPLDAMPLPELVAELEGPKFYGMNRYSRALVAEAAIRLRTLEFERNVMMLSCLRTRTPKEIGRIIDEAWEASKEARPQDV